LLPVHGHPVSRGVGPLLRTLDLVHTPTRC
jgi:hypothetical protein